ncbi:MAG TPA: hypothetical protein VG433_08325 [Pirellulales bacterium]|jgi:hypothetical protein|nr:hypothetical protein [Pirellulales bacterium]
MRTVLIAILLAGLGWFPAAVSAQSAGRAENIRQGTIASSNAALDARPDRWRYRWHQNHWWYYTPQQTWLWYENNAWKPFITPPPAPASPIAQPGPSQQPVNQQVFGVVS